MNPSLLLIPDRYKASKLYSQIPDSGAGDLAFTRANDTATRVNSAGLIEKVRTNLALHSEDLTNAAYVVQNATITANTTTAPNGTTTADTYNEGASSTAHRFYQQFTITANGEYGFSFFAKKNNLDIIRLVVNDLNENFRWFGAQFDLTAGTITANATGSAGGATYIGGSITSVGDGWYRCSINGTINTTTALCFVHSSTSTAITASDDRGGISYAGTSRTFFGWGFQFETGVTTPYIPTTTAAVSVGPVANIPRIDYTGGGCGKLLLEPQRTNLVLFSEQFDNSAWTKVSTSVTANNSISPSGLQDADTVVISGGGYILAEVFPFAAVTGQSLTISVFAKNQITNFLLFGGATAAGTDVYSIQNYGNGWFRHIRTRTFTTTASTTAQFIIGEVGSHIMWGAQMEAGSYVSSYIPTLGASVTRSADAASKTGISSLIGQTAGTLYIDVQLDARAQFTYFTLSPNLTVGTNYLGILIGSASIAFESVVGSALQAGITLSNSATGRFKIAAAYNTNDFVLYVNGSQVGTDTSGSVPACSEIGLYEFAQVPSLKYNTAALYTTRLSNSELASLTSL